MVEQLVMRIVTIMPKGTINTDKLKHFFHNHTDKPEESIDMKKASMIRSKHPKYNNMDIKALKLDPIWKKTNTNGEYL